MILLNNYEKTQFIPITIGIFIGLLIISDFYLVNILALYFDDVDLLKIIPFEVSILIFLVIITACILLLNIGKVIKKREILFIILLIIGLQSKGIFPGRIELSDLFFALFIAFWLITVVTIKKYEIVSSPLNFLNLAFLSFAILSVINGRLLTINSMMPLIKAILTSFLIIDIIRKKEWVIFFLKALFVITTFSAIIGIIQEILFLYNGMILAQYEAKYLSLMLEPTSFGTFLRVSAFTGMHLYLANYIVIALLIGFNALLYLNPSLERREKFILLIAMLLMFSALILTFSKTNMLGLAVGTLISLFVKWRSRAIQLLMLLLFIMVLAYFFGVWNIFHEYFTSDMEFGEIRERLELMKSGIEGFLYKHTFIGTGLGKGTEYTYNVMGWPAHNAFVQAADEVGIFGFIIFCSIFIYGLLRIVLTIPIIKELKEKAILIMLFAGLAGYLVNIQFQPDFLSYYTWLYIGFVECTVIVLRKEARKPTSKVML